MPTIGSTMAQRWADQTIMVIWVNSPRLARQSVRVWAIVEPTVGRAMATESSYQYADDWFNRGPEVGWLKCHGHLKQFAKVSPTVGSSLGHSWAGGRAHLWLTVLAAKVGKTETTTVGPTMVTKPWSPE